MKRFFTLLLILISFTAYSQDVINLNYYLPSDEAYQDNIPKPKDILGHEVGEWHVTHDLLVQYMYALAEKSDRIQLIHRGKTFEGRSLPLLVISTPENIQNIEEIRTQHLKLSDASQSGQLNINEMPVVVYQGFSIHGNEPSGSNASLLLAYHLAASKSAGTQELLSNTVVLLDPSFNPDGLQRFASWVNTNRSIKRLNPDPQDREYTEVWPRGRTNHYWFDMNRDWLPVQLPESRSRIQSYHEWMPNVLTDHHEMGTGSTYFFQPGEPDRVHPLTPPINQELTQDIADFHIEALDKIGSLYYSRERFDDYFYGKGSTFPDVNGAVGILFEQASSRGHIQESENGLLTFPFTIRNQLTTALSTLKAAHNLRVKLLTYQKDYFNLLANEAKATSQTIVFGDEKDAVKAMKLVEILKRHQIKVHHIKEDFELEGKLHKKGHSFIVPKNQKNPRLIDAIFEKRTSFKDSLFYDVSAWTFPLAFNLDYTEFAGGSRIGELVEEIEFNKGTVSSNSSYAYLFEWNEYFTPKALYRILEKGIRVKVANSQFTMEGKQYDYGTIMIPIQNQHLDKNQLYNFLREVAEDSHLSIDAVSTGFAEGADLGSGSFKSLELPKVAMLVGQGVTSYDAGEIWYLFDQQYEIPLTKLDQIQFNSADLSRYTTLIIPNANSSTLDETGIKKLTTWVENGGTLIGYRNSLRWFNSKSLITLNFKTAEKLVAESVSFENKSKFTGAQVTGGTIFETTLDRSHPINFGYKNDKLSLFRNTNVYLEADEQSYNNPIQYTQNPLLSGYVSKQNLELIKGTVPFKYQKKRKGEVIVFTDNTNFRAFWFGTNKLLMNAIYFSKMM